MRKNKKSIQHRLLNKYSPSIQGWNNKLGHQHLKEIKKNVAIDCGWGRLLFGHTFEDNKKILESIRQEKRGQRDIAFYVSDPHVLVSLSPTELFLSPSHVYRLNFNKTQSLLKSKNGFHIRKAYSKKDFKEINRILKLVRTFTYKEGFRKTLTENSPVTIFVAEVDVTREIIGVVMGINHQKAFNDPENGASMWALAVDPQASLPAVGINLVNHLIDFYKARGCNFLDLSVMHDNHQAIGLYEKIGFEKIPVFTIKYKNQANEKLFSANKKNQQFSIYAQVIVDEALQRGIKVIPINVKENVFQLSYAGKNILCHESLCEFTSALAYKRCNNKRLTNKVLKKYKINVPEQILIKNYKTETVKDFLSKHKKVVIKPDHGEGGQAVSVGLTTLAEIKVAIKEAKKFDTKIIIEEFINGIDVRAVVINHKFIAAINRTPPVIIGTGKHSIKTLIEKLSRRRYAISYRQSQIPLDAQTKSCIEEQGFKMSDILKKDKKINVRKNANYNTGAIIADVTNKIQPEIKAICEKASRALRVPVVGIDLVIKSLDKNDYYIIEANERPGLANHAPQPVVEEFVDYLFPQTKVNKI